MSITLPVGTAYQLDVRDTQEVKKAGDTILDHFGTYTAKYQPKHRNSNVWTGNK